MPDGIESQFQHHTPKTYLKRWSVTVDGKPKRVWVYEKGKEPRHAPIKETGGRDNMYGVVRADGTVDLKTVERYIARAESRAGKVFPKIMRRETLRPIERDVMAIFISIMYRRDPYTMDAFAPESLAPMIPDFHAEVVAEISSSFSDLEKQAEVLAAVEKAIAMSASNIPSLTSQATLNSEYMGNFFAQLHWGFFASRSASFVTSDTPVVFDRFRGIRDPHNCGVLFPLSSQLILWMNQWMPSPNTYTEIPDRLVDKLNKRIIFNAFNEDYATCKSGRIQETVDELIARGLPKAKSYSGE